MALLKTNTGIGITNPSAALHVIGDGLFIGIVSATTFYGNLGGGVQGSVPYQSAINNTTFLSPGSAGQVLVTGGSGQNPYWSPASSLVGSFSGITIKDEGTLVGSALSVSSLNFVGNNIVATASGADATITLSNDAQYLTGTAPASVISQSNGLNVTGSVNISGNLSVGGTSVILNAATLQIKDKDIVLGITTNALNQDISTDLSASHGGISIASTEGSPLINFPIEVGINSNPFTYKQLMWIKAGGYSGMGTDAWVSNYAISIGNTSTVANGSRLTVGTGFTVYDNLLYTRNIYSTGIITATQFVGSFSGNITGIASYATYSGIATYATNAGIATYATTSGVSTSVIGGIGSLTQLQVTGISTFSNGPVFIGAATSTGTASQRLQVTSGAYVSGNLGIGVTNPLYPLDLDTRLYVKSRTEGGDGSTGIDISSGVSTGIITRAHRIRTAGGGGGTLAIEAVSTGVGTGGGRINFVTNDTVRVAISSLGTLLVGGSIADQNIIGSAATTTLLQVTGDSYISGNLGIGSINPSSKLSVVGNVLISGIVTANNLTSQTLSVAGISTFTNGPVFIGAATSTGTASQPLQVTGGAYVSGNLGIGTTNPQAKLHLVGDTLVTGITTSSWKGSEGTLFSIVNNLSTGSIFSICDISGIPSIDVDANGTIAIAPYGNNLSKVGIGTTSPTSKLTVIGDVLVSGVITATAFIGNIATAGIASTAINLQGGDASQLAYQVSPGITSFIANGTPGWLLQSNGSDVPYWVNPAFGFNVSNADYALVAGVSTNVIGGIGSITQLQVTGVSTFSNGPVFIGAATSTGTASQRLQVTGGAYVSGNLGIGTTTPQAKLDVTDDALISGLTIGKGKGSVSTNTATGYQTLLSNTTGSYNTANGYQALNANTTGSYNTATGWVALLSNTTGSYNTANGIQSLNSNTIGNYNTAAGWRALWRNTTGSSNTATGYYALQANTTGTKNTANGVQALYFNTTGSNNTANGYLALQANTTGNYNTATGYVALRFNTTGSQNTANGYLALYTNTTGNYNTATGYVALRFNTTGSQNTANGYGALSANTTGYRNTATGANALGSNTTGLRNTANGYKALYTNTTGNSNTANGYSALGSNTGNNNTATGYGALSTNTTGSNNTANGVQALQSNTTGSNNTATGFQALYANTTGYQNTATGHYALTTNTTANNNTATGYQALQANTTGSNNTATGKEALAANTTGSSNTATGYYALQANTIGYNNTANGFQALRVNTTGANNTANGYRALNANTTGSNNTANGIYALYSNTTGIFNTATGYAALYSNTTGANNTANGYNAGYNLTTGSNNSFIGYNAQPSAVSVSNEITLGDTNVDTLRVPGLGFYGVRTNTTVATTSATTIDSIVVATYRSARIQIQITQGTNYQVSDVLLIHDGTTASIIEYGTLATNLTLCTYSATISSGNALLQVNMGSATSSSVKVLSYRTVV